VSDVLQVSNSGHVRTLRLNRPEKKNALSNELAWAIITAVEAAAEEDDVWIIGITGTADAFCSGLDLTPGEGGGRGVPMSPQTAYLDDLGWVSRFPIVLRERCDKPIVAGLNGVAVSLIGAGAVRRTVIRSAKCLPSSGTGTNGRETACTTPYLSGTAANTSLREPPSGHQNSSASLRSTQSAPCPVAARRAIRVTHSA